jgi:putative membrane protein
MSIADLPTLNATLNGIATLLLITAYVLIKRGHREAHKKAMLGAIAVSAAFLTSYVIYHYNIGGPRPFAGQGASRIVYYVILATHVPLAMLVLPLALVTAARGLMSRFDRHVTIARWTFPIWLYVSVTGVLIYLMLYRIY